MAGSALMTSSAHTGLKMKAFSEGALDTVVVALFYTLIAWFAVWFLSIAVLTVTSVAP